MNIRKRKDGLYEARYIKGRTAEGRIVYGSFYGKTLEEAAAKRQAERDKMTVRNNPPRQVGLIILGAGSHGAEVKEIAKMLRVFGRIDYLDDDTSKEGVIGTWQDAAKFRENYGCAIVAVGNRKLRELWFSRLTEMGYVIPTLGGDFRVGADWCRNRGVRQRHHRNQREAGRGLHHFFQRDRGQRRDGGGLVPH